MDATVPGASTLYSDMLRVSGILYFVTLVATSMRIDFEVSHDDHGRFQAGFQAR
jgi:hypothetical protein